MTGTKIAQADSFLWWGLIRSHDAFFKWLMDQPGVAEALLEFVLSQELRRFWDGTALVPLPGSLITRELAERRTDRTYLCPSPNGVPAPLMVVFEHKSAPDRETPWQVTQYLYEQARAWMAGRKSLPRNERYRLPVMAAVVVYQGKWRWRVPLTLLGSLAEGGADGPGASQLSNVRYMLIDILRTPIERLPPVPRLRVAFMIWQFDRKSPGTFKQRLVELARAALALGVDDLTAMIYYLWGQMDQRGIALLGEVLDEVVPGRKEQVMQTVGDQLVAQGLAKGLAQGLAQGLADGLADGLAKGEARGVAKTLLRQLQRRFGNIRSEVAERIRTADITQLDDWSDRILDAKTLEDVFGVDRRH